MVDRESDVGPQGAVRTDGQPEPSAPVQPETAALDWDARRVAPAIRAAMRLLELEQVDPPAIEDLAARVGLSPAHFSRAFATALGQTSAAYGRRIRLDHAASRMLFDPAPVGEVARLFGFDSQAAFNRAFRRQHRAAPRAFVAGLRRAGAGPGTPPADPVVAVVERPAEPALARRFFGPDIAEHWRRFRAELPAPLARARRQAGLLYDLPAVTPPHHRRYDCAIPIRPRKAIDPALVAEAGLDAIELPGGIHAEIPGCATPADVSAAISYLYGTWLPAHRGYAPEGDPMVHWCGEGDEPGFTATIRLRRLPDPPEWNLMPLDAALQPVGSR